MKNEISQVSFLRSLVTIVNQRKVWWHKFNSCVQLTTESAFQFITDLKLLSLNCMYGALRDEMIRDCLVLGIHSEEMKEKLQQYFE